MDWLAAAYGMDPDLLDATIEAMAEAMQSTSGTMHDEHGFVTWGPGFFFSFHQEV
jgi:hypothetical protein